MAELDFVENVAIWSFAGLLAVSATPLAAIAFLTVAPRFVIAMRTGDLGAVVSIYVDGIPAAVIDTHADAPGMLFQAILPDESLDTHQIYIQKDDNPDTIIEVLRKELTPDEIANPNVRYNPDCDCVQSSFDGGATWIDNPGADPRSSPTYQAPALTTADPRCDGAANMVEFLRQNVQLVVNALNAISLASEMLTFLTIAIPGIDVLFALMTILAGVLLAIGQSVIAAAFDDATYEALLCIFDCNISPDGSVTAAQLDTITTKINDSFGATVQLVWGYYVQLFGAVGWSNASALGTQTGDCTACLCNWCWTIDFTVTDGGFVSDTTDGNGALYVPGTGWTILTAGVYIALVPVPDVVYTQIAFTFDAVISGGTSTAVVAGVLDGAYVVLESAPYNAPVTDEIMAWNGEQELNDRIDLQLGATALASGTIKSVTFRGLGDNPFGSDNC